MKNTYFFIDYGSAGNAGFYAEKKLESSHKFSGNVVAFLHKDFEGSLDPDIKVIRCFGCLSWVAEGFPLYNFFRALELYVSVFFILAYVAILSLKGTVKLHFQLYQSFNAYFILAKLSSVLGSVLVTIHDAVELAHNYPRILMFKRAKLADIVDCVFVHNAYSVDVLQGVFKNIKVVPFPVTLPHKQIGMYQKDLTPLKLIDNKVTSFHSGPRSILFIGNVREEKGLPVLIKAWDMVPSNKSIKLTVAGSGASCAGSIAGVRVIDSFIDDDVFYDLIANAHFVVYPYKGGTNSGVLAVSSSLLTPSITSDISLFKEFPFCTTDYMFESGNYSSLADMLTRVGAISADEYRDCLEQLYIKFIQFDDSYKREMDYFYENV